MVISDRLAAFAVVKHITDCFVMLGSFEINVVQMNAITDKTRAIVINSPSNPTGVMLSFEKLCKIADIVKKHELFVIADDIYLLSVCEYRKKRPFLGGVCI